MSPKGIELSENVIKILFQWSLMEKNTVSENSTHLSDIRYFSDGDFNDSFSTVHSSFIMIVDI